MKLDGQLQNEHERAKKTDHGAPWVPWPITVDGEAFTIEREPQTYNALNAFWEEGNISTDDAPADYESMKDWTTVVLIGEQRTLAVILPFEPRPLPLIAAITLPKRVDGQGVPGRVVFRDGCKDIDICSSVWSVTGIAERGQIQKARYERDRLSAAEVSYRSLPAAVGMYVGEELQVRIGSETYKVKRARAIHVLQEIARLCDERDTREFEWREIWEEALKHPVGRGRKGACGPQRFRDDVFKRDASDRLGFKYPELWRALFCDAVKGGEDRYRIKYRLELR